MNRRHALSMFSAVIGSAGLASIPGCATQPSPNAVPAPADTRPAALRVGQTLRYSVSNVFSGLRVGQASYTVRSVSGSAARIDVELPASHTYATEGAPRRGVLELLDSGHVKDEFHFEGDLHFRDPEAWLPDDLTHGQQYRNAYRVDADPRWRRWDTRLTPLGWERVRVPAGEFVALLVKREMWFDHPENWRLSNIRVERLWHAPSVGFWVRREMSGQYVVPSDKPEVFEEDRILMEMA